MDGLGPQGQPPSASRAINSFANKVSTVLSTSYADPEFREALSLLDERGLRNSLKERRQLRLNAQRDVIQSNGNIVTEFGRVANELQRIQTILNQLNSSYNDMRERISGAHEQCSSFLEEASLLMRQRSEVEANQRLLRAFRNRFVLTDDEVFSLTSTAEPVDDEFFVTLAKAKRIMKDCDVLLGFESQTLGLEIVEQTTKNLNLAFQKLYKWVQKEFKTLNLENPHLDASIRRAIRVLAERPSLFQGCLDSFADARQHILSDAFYVALTGTTVTGQPDSFVKPIEMAAHDPLRYAGDMLAWLHSAAVGEREALEGLFLEDGDEIAKGLQSGHADKIWQLMQDVEPNTASEFDALKALHDLVDRDVEGVGRILRQRIEQVVQSNEDIILSYQLANLLGFYRYTFTKLLGEETGLYQLMSSLEAEALRQFRSLVRDQIATLQVELQQDTPSDLGPPDYLHDALHQLTAIMQTYETSLSASADREADFQTVLAEAFDPFIASCKSMAKTIGPHDGAIFSINCLIAAITTLRGFDFTRNRVTMLQAQADDELTKLVDDQYRFLRETSGLDEIFTCLGPLSQDPQDVETLHTLDPMRPEALGQASQALDEFLPSALMDAMDRVKLIQDPNMAREVTEKAAERFCRDFEHVEKVLTAADELSGLAHGEEQGQKEPFRVLFPRTIAEIRVLLS
ncbi:hypothetical protein ACRALDRAFT_1058939 [Sodiomyces alcalophilus JCM 7366]|uniref:uncharacterized protein n=1 Tax=Sodiomyces alcalophilus JCM 7366 TaxID=591952 RepID=UPI0039B3D6B9